jgi:predicted regulator of Ras-like GTPase activity (Roadblock/LC7/MglB family)
VGFNAHQSKAAEPTSLQEILHALNETRKFEAVVLASADGLLIATAPTDYDSEVTAALVALLQKVSSEAQQQLGMAEVDEVTIRSRDRVRLVCRHLDVGNEGLILVVVVTPGRYYRRVTNRAIKQIRQLLS